MFAFYFKSKHDSTAGVFKLAGLTIFLTLTLVPIYVFNSPTGTAFSWDSLSWFVSLEVWMMAIFVMPPAWGMLWALYSTRHDTKERKFEYGSYGYIIGFFLGLLILLAIFGSSSEVPKMIAVAFGALAAGFLLSLISIRPRRTLKGAPIGQTI